VRDHHGRRRVGDGDAEPLVERLADEAGATERGDQGDAGDDRGQHERDQHGRPQQRASRKSTRASTQASGVPSSRQSTTVATEASTVSQSASRTALEES
jgi:hypothetical protein